MNPARGSDGAEVERQVSRTLRTDNITVGIDTLEEGGVKQSSTTVNYRVKQPDQPMPILVTQSYGGRDTS